MSKSQPWCFILSTQTYVNIRLTHPRCLPSFSLPVSHFNCLPILHPDMRVPLLSNVIKIRGQSNLSVSLSRKWERKLQSSTSPSLAVTFHLMSAGTSQPILNESLLSELTGEGWGKQVLRFQIYCRTTGQKQLIKTEKLNRIVAFYSY